MTTKLEGTATLPPVTCIEEPIYLDYNFTAGHAASRFLKEIKKGRLVGQRCPSCRNVYVPPRGLCAACGVPMAEDVELSNKATIESFTVVHIPLPGNPIKPPFVVANIVPDGANVSFIHLVSDCDINDVRIGMRIEARWRDRSQWSYSMENIQYYAPIDEPDIPRESIGRLD